MEIKCSGSYCHSINLTFDQSDIRSICHSINLQRVKNSESQSSVKCHSTNRNFDESVSLAPFSNSGRDEHDLSGRHAVGVRVALRVVAGVDVAQVVVDVVAVVVVVGVGREQVDHVEDGQQESQDAESSDGARS